MNISFRSTVLAGCMAALAIFSSAGCPDDKENVTPESLTDKFWTVSGTKYFAVDAVAYVPASAIVLVCDTSDVLNAQRLEFSLQGSADGTGSPGGLRKGKYTLGPGGANSFSFDWGKGGNMIKDYAVSGSVEITSNDGTKLSAKFDCITDKGKVINGELNSVHID